ncbi:MAG TPA: Gfo/Idh/MocA family oxidoreductase [Clostridia bacterium]|nr:Gfo/Idh/MocA family oxidoreductase [Clostridia bacterium]HQM96967.1 Gfo/Idh/MocA family oxidoreductase [Clostridia bacterium]HQO70043.1 Gfo/Idh/MocA family oxidoreductase [Clostridia bacterium]
MKIVVVGIGGYGEIVLNGLFANPDKLDFTIEGYVAPRPKDNDYSKRLHEMGAERYITLEDFYEKKHADLAVISSPIEFHMPQTILCLSHNTAVMCEKPVAGTIQDAYAMKNAEDSSAAFVGIGYQWSYSDAIINLKKDILSGMYGKPTRLKNIVLWPRTQRYFKRNSWAGKIKNDSGYWILDSVANNATAHYIHNMFFVLGDSLKSSAWPKTIQANIYRANDIENYDTCVSRIITQNDVEILYYASHSTETKCEPLLDFQFEKGEIYADFNKEKCIYGKVDGKIISYGNPFDVEMKKVFDCIRTIKGDDVNYCPIDAAIPQLKTINAISQYYDINQIAPDKLGFLDAEENTTKLVYVKGLYQDMMKAYSEGRILDESSKVIDITGYDHFENIKQ